MKKRPALVDLVTHDYPFVTVPELASYLMVDARTLHRMIDDGSLHAVRVGRQWRIPIEEARRAFPVERASRASKCIDGTNPSAEV
jgi:excisionase family DNA binding protein